MVRVDQIYKTLGPYGVQAAYGTRQGHKASGNEDAVMVSLPSESSLEAGILCVVADGVGGISQGATASNAAVQAVASTYHSLFKGDPPVALRNAVLAAHEAVRQATATSRGNPEGATTMVAAVLQKDELWIANVGDSRAYVLDPEGNIAQITVDHSWIQEQIQAGAMTRDEAAVHPWRKVITGYLGGEKAREIDIFHRRLSPGEKVLLCSDGLTEVVRDNEIGNILSNSDSETVVKSLLELADERGARDDVTICVVQPNLADYLSPSTARNEDTISFHYAGQSSHRARAIRILATVLATIFILLTVTAGAAWAATEGRITPGVLTSSGVHLGGMTSDSAASIVMTSMAPSLTCSMTLQVQGRRWTFAASELGLWVDGEATAAVASSIGHHGSIQQQASERITTALNRTVVQPVVRVNTQTLLWQLIVLANDFDRDSDPTVKVDIPKAMFIATQQLLEHPCSQVELPARTIDAPQGS